jgi:putative ABC transport system permease protein
VARVLLTWSEMRRSPGRFALLGGAVALLVLLLLFFQAVAGTLTSELTGAIAGLDGDVIVYDDSARRSPQASVLAPEVVDQVAAVDGVAAAAGVTWVPYAVDGIDSVLVGVEPAGPGVPTDVSEGRLPSADGEAALAVSALADDAPAAAIGDRVTLPGIDGGLEIVGLVDGAAANALPTWYVTLPAVRAAVDARAGATLPATLSFVAVAADGDAQAVAERIAAEVDGVEALDRATAVTSLPGIGTISQSFGILYLLLYLVVGIVTAVFFLILTVQKRDALLLLRAVGARRRDVVVPTLLQLMIVVGFATIVGGGTASALLWAARDTFGATLDPVTVALTSGSMLALGLLAGTMSVRRILRIEPVEVVRTAGLE